ncbi:hypothetical protein PTT_12043 [Pyrenophora teres f. teres 0-1]|uniref:Uncharacterized protein n=1 Tax=Pyrenophora teres f. teres (strain 0-1) TaxID=861557 RepID=E3RSV5_PYRTT|nr:hypothetical protein PTT_12043 [Pyrenophora teres f. teres 0-1]
MIRIEGSMLASIKGEESLNNDVLDEPHIITAESLPPGLAMPQFTSTADSPLK